MKRLCCFPVPEITKPAFFWAVSNPDPIPKRLPSIPAINSHDPPTVVYQSIHFSSHTFHPEALLTEQFLDCPAA